MMVSVKCGHHKYIVINVLSGFKSSINIHFDRNALETSLFLCWQLNYEASSSLLSDVPSHQ